MKPCFKLDTLAFPIALTQTGLGFTVVYGQQVKRGLSYSDAARELGQCIMHALACNGDLEGKL